VGGSGIPAGPAGAVAQAPVPRRRRNGRRATWSAEDLERDPRELLAPYADQVTALARSERYEDAARVRDDAERLRHLLSRHRRVESLRRAGRIILLVEGEGTIELNGGLLIETGSLFSQIDGATVTTDPAFAVTADGHENERLIVAQWLKAHADEVRVLEVESTGGTDGMSMPADRIPRLTELCAAIASPADTGASTDAER